MAFAAQNARFYLPDNGMVGLPAYGDLLYPQLIDQPRRFGDGRYSRFDPGETTLRIDGRGVTAGFSSAAQFWGPAFEHPLILGNNAGGFPHLFLGTARPVHIGIGTIHGRLVWGRLDHSPYAFSSADLPARFMSGLVATLVPRGVPGLEIGAARFFHAAWPEGGLSGADFLKPFEGFLKSRFSGEQAPDGSDPDNQLASIFARWAFPRAGMEFFVEFAREDHSWDARDLWLEPDHDAALALGLQRVWRRKAALYAARAELVNSRLSHLQQGRPQEPFYIHTTQRQGHTHRGQVLGSPGVFGGGAAVLAVDRYDRRGRLTLSWTRLMHGERRSAEGLAIQDSSAVSHSIALDGFRETRLLDVIGGLTATREFNREFSRDAINLRLVAGLRGRW
jgi:hypothetical protein